jgi:ubiquinone biosynthesis protein UbiJ
MNTETPQYRTPLPGLLASMLETSINRLLAMDPETPQRLSKLQGHLLRLDLEGVGISLYFSFTSELVRVALHDQDEPDTVISGSPAALFSMAVPDDVGAWGAPGSRVTITGDATLARDLERLFSRLDPDWEAGLARLFGDVWGHQVAAGIRAGVEQARGTADNAGEMFSDFLQREDGPLVSPEELKSFADAVDEARDAVERLEARLRLVAESAGDAG